LTVADKSNNRDDRYEYIFNNVLYVVEVIVIDRESALLKIALLNDDDEKDVTKVPALFRIAERYEDDVNDNAKESNLFRTVRL